MRPARFIASVAALAALLLPVTAAPPGAQAASLPVGPVASPAVQPGGVVHTPLGDCTLNFLFMGSDGARYIGTAGHCILDGARVSAGDRTDGSEQTWAAGTGPEATQDGKRIGEFAYAVLADPKDFALIRLDPDVAASAQMAHFGGPTGINEDTGSDMVTLEYYGNGAGIGTALPARSAVAYGTPDPDHITAIGVVAPGDSGGGVISSDGRAVGVLVTLGADIKGVGTNGVEAGDVGVTRLAPQVARAQELLGGLRLTMQTAPLL